MFPGAHAQSLVLQNGRSVVLLLEVLPAPRLDLRPAAMEQ